ncbi:MULTISPECIES: hypothetical protein [unclassified Streptomyces]|uniref:hypothetical protein n=1 Tax=unclassified Streptomyces TaxID=2593676 RepID=UPI0033AEB12C
MNRDTLRSVLVRDGSVSAHAALAELEAGADFEINLNSTASASLLWTNWSARQESMREMGIVPSRPGLADAVESLHAAGTARVHMATITGPQKRFLLFLSEDLTECVASW